MVGVELERTLDRGSRSRQLAGTSGGHAVEGMNRGTPGELLGGALAQFLSLGTLAESNPDHQQMNPERLVILEPLNRGGQKAYAPLRQIEIVVVCGRPVDGALGIA